jgi:hypothetical protein
MRIFLIPLGIGLLLYSPYYLWDAESQHRANDFGSAPIVSIESQETGHLTVKGLPESKESILCPSEEEDSALECVSVSTTISDYTLSEVEKCSSTRPSRVIQNLAEKCDSEGENCKPCYLVEKEEWKQISSDTDFAAFKIGNYSVPSAYEAEILGQESLTTYTSWEELDGGAFFEDRVVSESSAEPGDRQTNYSFLSIDGEYIVSGNANESMEIGAGEKTFVISTISQAETVGQLESRDTQSKWMLRLLSMAMVIFGFIFIFNTIAAIPLMLVKIIPFLGPKLEAGLSGIISFIAGAIGLVLWGFMWGAILLLKNILALIVIGAVLVGGAFAVYSFAKKNHIPLKKTTKELKKK